MGVYHIDSIGRPCNRSGAQVRFSVDWIYLMGVYHIDSIGRPCNRSGSIRGGDNTPLGGSLPRRSQRPGRKNSLSQRPCVRDQGEPYSNCGFRLWSI